MRQTQHDRYLTLLLNLRRTWTSERIGFTNATYRAAYLPCSLVPKHHKAPEKSQFLEDARCSPTGKRK